MNSGMFRNKALNILSYSGLLFAFVIIIFFVFKFFVFSTPPDRGRGQDDGSYYKEMQKNYIIYNPKIPEFVDFAGEPMPIKDFDVYQSLDYEIMKIMFWHSEMMLYLKRKAYIFSVVEPILKEYKVPDDFKYLLVTESGMVNVVSPAKAEGYWQFLKKTGQEYNLEINNEVDERYNLEKSTVAACKYLKDSYRALGSWTLAAASYNSGRRRLTDEMTRQKMSSFYDLILLRETSRYLYRIVAYKIIMSNPRDFGFNLRESDSYLMPKTKVVKVTSGIPNLVEFAIKYGTNYKILKMLNPWLRSDKLTNSTSKTYYIRIPIKDGRKVY